MKHRPRILMILSVAVACAAQIACATAQPANTNQPSVNANAAPSNSPQTKTTEQPVPATGTIEVISAPSGARVLLIAIDEDTAGEPQSKGLTPATITGVRPGKYAVDLEKPGYRFFQKEITVKKGSTVKVNATLKKR